ncbi:MAG: S-layer homology domain-containing protein [Bryobacterales bacterium]|nr:S-layer homology domain-containing protein [Bryobacterales bacterium]
MRCSYCFILLVLSATILAAQPVTVEVNATFDRPVVIGTGANTVTASLVPIGRVRLNPPAIGFDVATLLRVRLDVTGNLMEVQWSDSFIATLRVTLTPEGSQQSLVLTGVITPVISPPRRFLRVEMDQQAVALDGVSYSFLDLSRNLLEFGLPAAATTFSDLRGRATRSAIRIQSPPLRLTVTPGQTLLQRVFISAPADATISVPDAFSTWEAPNTARIDFRNTLRMPARRVSLISVKAYGVAPAYLPVELQLLPGDQFLNLSPSDIQFTYTRGQPPPPSKVVSISSSGPFSITPNSWDRGWLDPVAGSDGVTLTPRMTDKNTGSHRTIVSVQNAARQSDTVHVNFFVSDGPGLIRTSAQPLLGGTVTSSAAGPAANGTKITLTANPNPGFTFGRWSGAVNDIANPVNVFVNGTTEVSAHFEPVTGSCSYDLAPGRITGRWEGNAGKVEVRTQDGCPWTVTGMPQWMELTSPPAGIGPGFVTYRFGPQPFGMSGEPRRAFLRVGDRILLAEQAGTFCLTVLANLLSPPAPARGGTVGVEFAATSGCHYTPRSSRPWITLPQAEGPYLSSRELAATVLPNPGTLPRIGSVSALGRRVTILQRAANPTAPYADVPDSHPFADFVAILKSRNAAVECGPDVFCPDARVTRAQAAQMIERAAYSGKLDYPRQVRFFDVPSNHPQFPSIQTLTGLGALTACGTARFCPDEPISRRDVAAWIYSALTGLRTDAPVPARGGSLHFVDVSPNSAFWRQITELQYLGIATGCYYNAYCPDEPTTRGQLAAFLVRAFFAD